MATSGSIDLRASNSILTSGTLTWAVKSSSPANNTYTLTFTATVKPLVYISYNASRNEYLDVFIQNKDDLNEAIAIKWEQNLNAGVTYTKSRDFTFEGNNITGASAGFNRNLWISVDYNMVQSGSLLNYSITGLPALDRKTKFGTTPTSMTLGTAASISLSKTVSDSTSTLSLSLGGASQTFATKSSSTSISCNAALNTFAPKITTATSATGTLTLTSYIENTSLGSVTKNITVNVPSSCVPSFSGNITLSDTAMWSGSTSYYAKFGSFLSSLSNLHLTWQEVISQGSAINTRTGTIFGSTATLSNVSSTGCDVAITALGGQSGTATITLKDKRGRTGSKTTSSFSVVSYSKPSLGTTSVYRASDVASAYSALETYEVGDYCIYNWLLYCCNTEITTPEAWDASHWDNVDAKSIASDEGNRIAVNLNYSKTSFNNNYAQVDIYVNNVLTESYGNNGRTSGSTPSDADNGLHIINQTFNPLNTYTIKVTLTDTVGQSATSTFLMSPSSRPLSIRTFMVDDEKKWGMAIGKTAETAGALEIAVPTIHIGEGQSEARFVNKPGNSVSYIRAYAVYDQGVQVAYGNNMVINPGGNLILGSGESAHAIYSNNVESAADNNEHTYIASDNTILFFSNCNTIANRHRMAFQSNGALLLTGGNFYSRSETINSQIGQTIPSDNTAIGSFTIQDNQAYSPMWLTTYKNENDRLQCQLGFRRKNASGTAINHSLSLYIDSSGTRTVGVSDPAAWRAGIGAVNIAGDTMTGNLILQSTSGMAFSTKCTGINSQIGKTIPSSNTSLGALWRYDSESYQCFYSDTYKTTGDDLYTSFVTRRKDASGTVIANGFYQRVNSDGTAAITWAGNGKTAWLNGLGLNATRIYKNIGTTSVANATDTTIGNTGSLATGVYVVMYRAAFATNTSGRRVVFLASSTSGSVYETNRMTEAPAAGAATELVGCTILELSSATTIYLRVYQNSGGALDVTGQLKVIKIHD